LRRFADGIPKARLETLHQLVIERCGPLFGGRRRRGRFRRRRSCGSAGRCGSSGLCRSSRLGRNRCGCGRRFWGNGSAIRRRFRRIGGRFGSRGLFRRIVSHRFDRLKSPKRKEPIRSIAREQPAFLTHPKKQRQRIRIDISGRLKSSRARPCGRARCNRPAKSRGKRAWSEGRRGRAGRT